MRPILFSNVFVFDGSGSDRFAAEVLVEGERIARVVPAPARIDCQAAVRVDGGGATLMPGLVEAHAHLSFASSRGRIVRQRVLPPEENLLITAYNARVYLDHGFTSAYSAGSKGPRFEVALKKEIDGGYLPGPRLVPSTFERAADADKQRSGPEALGRFVAEMAADGVQSIKLLLSGDDAFGNSRAQDVEYSDEEVAAAHRQAQASGVWLAAHAQAAEAVKIAARNGVRVVYHCTHADEEALDLVESRKADMFVAPAIGIVYAKAYLAEEFGFTPEKVRQLGLLEQLEQNVRVYEQMRKRGVRVLPGGDYGFAWNPIGENARDLELFVTLFGWSPSEVLRAATQWGAELMGMGDRLGQVREGYLADLLLVAHDPLLHIERLREADNLLAIMQNGRFHKAPAGWEAHAAAH